MSRRTVVAVLFAAVAGVLLVQAAWALTVPPFRGLDEHDHAYRAASVARGDWSAHHPRAEEARGDVLVVPEDLVRSAQPICEDLDYTDPGNCTPIDHLGDGSVTIASAAARYHPAFYYLIGTPSRFFDGADSLYAMRAAAAVLCALFIGLAVVTTRLWARTPWPTIAVLLALTPTFFYSTAVAAPNGLEAASAMLVWAALLGIARSSPTSSQTRTFLVLATLGALPLASVRGLGALWLFLIVCAAALLLPPGHLKQLTRRWDAIACGAIVGLVALFGVGWTLYARSIDASIDATQVPGSPWPGLPIQSVLWFLQSVAAIPTRNEPSPPAVYAIVLVTWALLAFFGVRRASRRGRIVLAAVLIASTVVPVAATVATYEQIAFAWQGRYMYPFSMGFLLICGYALDRSRLAPWRLRGWPVLTAAVAGLTVALMGLLDVLADQIDRSALSGSPAWHTPSPALLVLLSAGGFALLAWALTRRLGSNTPQ